MADTLTIKQDDQTTDVENLTTEEKDSLQVGEEMAKEQGELLAGKYKNAEDLEKAYVELQKKLGDKEENLEEPEAEKQEEVKEETEKSEAYTLIQSASDEYYANENQLKPETLEKFKNMSSQDLVDAYLTRRILDHLIGFKVSPLLWRHVSRAKSAGRVQSPTLRLLCEKEDQRDLHM